MFSSETIDGWLDQLREERRTLVVLAERAGLGAHQHCDIHLCYAEIPAIAFSGFLISTRGNIDLPIAYCPILKSRMQSNPLRAQELRRAFALVEKIAVGGESARHSPGLCWLGLTESTEQVVPGWIYGLHCVPLAGDWDGMFHTPRPFCPQLFEHMARQPRALRWLKTRPDRPIEHSSLSDRPQEVLSFLTKGYSEKETAVRLSLSRHTVHEHVKHLYRHFGVHSRGELLSLFVSPIMRSTKNQNPGVPQSDKS